MLLFLNFLLLFVTTVYSHSVTQISNFDQFVKFYGKHYKEDEYARRTNFVENSQRLKTTKKLIGTDLQYSFYSDFSELRFRKSLMMNNRYPKPDLADFGDGSNITGPTVPSVNWKELIPPLIDVDPSIKCASSWAVAVTTLLYMKYKEQDPLWDQAFSVQQLLDCVNDRYAITPDSCDGASMESALRYVYEKGLCLEKDYHPYVGVREKCVRTSCNRYFIKSYKRLYPTLQSLLSTVSKEPVISVVGVNPSVLQFFVSESHNHRNYLIGNFHRFFIAGIVTSYDISQEEEYVTLTLPSFHPLSRNLHFLIDSHCISNTYSDDVIHNDHLCGGDASLLAYYAYTLEMEPLPRFPHFLKYSIYDNNRLLFLAEKKHWIFPWSFALYQQVSIQGFHKDELSVVLDRTLKGLQLPFMSSELSIPFPSEFKRCRISQLSVTGLFPMDCSYSSLESALMEDDDSLILFQNVDGLCQLNDTMLSTLLNFIPYCVELETIRINDQGFNARQVIIILSTLLSNLDKLTKLREVQLIGSFINKDSSNAVHSLISMFEQHGITVSGIALFEEETEDLAYFSQLMNHNYPSFVTYSKPISEETYEKMILTSPFRFASKVALQNTCTSNPRDCSYVPSYLSTLFSRSPHHYLRILDLTNNQITTMEAFRLLVSLKKYPRLSSIILDHNMIDDSFYASFKAFMQDSTVLPSLRRISFLNNLFSAEVCKSMREIFFTRYERSALVFC